MLGASEGMAAAFRSLLAPGDGVVVMQPYHELYPSQAAIFGLAPRFVTLREDRRAGTWRLDRDELRAALTHPDGQGDSREHPPEPDRHGAGLRGPGIHRGALPGARPVRDHRRDLRAHHLRRPPPPLPGALRGDGGPYAGGERDLEDRPRDRVARRLGHHAAGSHAGVARGPRQPRRAGADAAAEGGGDAPAPAPVVLRRDRRRGIAKSATCWSAGCARSGSRRPRRKARTTCSRTTALCRRWRRCRRRRPPCTSSSRLVWRRWPGDNFYATGREGDRYLRFAFCRSLQTLEEGIERLRARLR